MLKLTGEHFLLRSLSSGADCGNISPCLQLVQVEKGVRDRHSSVIYLGWSEYFPEEFVKYSLNDQRHKHVTPGHWRESYLKSTKKSKSERLSGTRKHLI